jgi:catechol 2,3-dioxygenase-like lactoylglutathione lyase family enzyme
MEMTEVGNSLGWPTWIGVVAENLEAQRRFYRDTLGLTEKGSGPGWVQFDLGGHMFEVIQRADTPQYGAPRFQVGFTVQDIESARAELIRRGVEPLTEIEPTEPRDTANSWCYFRDPEGNVFEITEWLKR